MNTIFRKAEITDRERILEIYDHILDEEEKGPKMILAYYEELARKMNCTELRMDTGGTNSRARKIYADMGFIEADELEYSYTEKPEEVHKVIFLEKYIGA